MGRTRKVAGAWSKTVAAVVTAGCAVVLAACQATTALPRRAEPFTPPAAFQRWWDMAQKCAGRQANFAAVKWYRMPGSQFRHEGRDVRGYYDPGENAIVLTDSLAAFAAGVRHEMLHALGVPGHPRDLFQQECATLVTCPASCEEDGGAWQAPGSWVPMKAESLAISAVAELLPTDLDGSRWLVIHTRVTNPRSRPIMAIMPPTYAFGFALVPQTGKGGVQDAMFKVDSSTYYFKANETKEFLFELVVGKDFTRYSVPPGDYVFAGGFGTNWSSSAAIKVTLQDGAEALMAHTP